MCISQDEKATVRTRITFSKSSSFFGLMNYVVIEICNSLTQCLLAQTSIYMYRLCLSLWWFIIVSLSIFFPCTLIWNECAIWCAYVIFVIWQMSTAYTDDRVFKFNATVDVQFIKACNKPQKFTSTDMFTLCM